MLKPLRNLVLVKREKKATMTAGGLYLPETAIEESYWVRILAVGPGEFLPDGTRRPMNAKVGSRMLLRQWCGLALDPELGFDSVCFAPDEQLEAIDE